MTTVLAALLSAAVIALLMAVLLIQNGKLEKEKRTRRQVSEADEKMRKDRLIRKHFVFSGMVQGVGFRYRARHAAELLDVTGWVENMPDGTVEMEVQGRPGDIEGVLRALEEGTWIRIEHLESRIVPIEEDERRFYVKGY